MIEIDYVHHDSVTAPTMTNREKFEKEFGYDGSIVSKAKPKYLKFGSCGYDYCTESCASRCFPRCPMWWDDEAKSTAT